jgi:hypothetical protein
MHKCSTRRLDNRFVTGFLLILVGGLIFIDRSNMIYFSIFDILALIAVLGGSIQIIQAQSGKDVREGAWWLFLGVWFYASYHYIFGYGFSDTWPLLIIAWGIGHLWKALDTNKNYRMVKE